MKEIYQQISKITSNSTDYLRDPQSVQIIHTYTSLLLNLIPRKKVAKMVVSNEETGSNFLAMYFKLFK